MEEVLAAVVVVADGAPLELRALLMDQADARLGLAVRLAVSLSLRLMRSCGGSMGASHLHLHSLHSMDATHVMDHWHHDLCGRTA